MASLIYKSNKIGTLTGPSSASEWVDMTFTSRSQADSIVITLFCQACGHVLSSEKLFNVNIGDVRTVSFDLSSLESSGHPGPFEFTPTGGEGEIYLDVVLKDDPPGAAKSFTGAGTYVVPFGGNVDVYVRVSDNDGYTFYRWENAPDVEFSTFRGVTLHFNNLVKDTTYELVAKFYSHAGVFAQASVEVIPANPDIALVKNVLTGNVSESEIEVAPEGEYSVTYSFQALRLSARYFCTGVYYIVQSMDGTWPESWSFSRDGSRSGTATRSRKYKFRFLELNSIQIAIRFHGYGHAAHGAILSLFVAEEDDGAGCIPISQGPFQYSSDAVASFSATDSTSVTYGVGSGSRCRLSGGIDLGDGIRFVRAVIRHTNATASTVYEYEYRNVEEFVSAIHDFLFYYRGSDINSIDIYLCCGMLMYNVTGYLIYDPSSNALVYCG